MTQIGSQQGRTVWPSRGGGWLPTRINLPIESLRLTLNTTVNHFPIPWATFLGGCAVSAMAARSGSSILLTTFRVDNRITFFRSVSFSICQPDFKGGIPKPVGGADGRLLEDGAKPESKARTALVAERRLESRSCSATSTGPQHTLCPVFRMMLPVFLVLYQVILFVAVADNSAWLPSVSDSSP